MNNLIDAFKNLKLHWRLYGLLVFLTVLLFSYLYYHISRAVHRSELVNESLLHLSSGGVSSVRGRIQEPVFSRSGDVLVQSPSSKQDRTDTLAVPTQYVPPEGSVTITPRDSTKTLDQVVNISYKKWGKTFEPGLVFGIYPQGFGLDFKWFYFYRFGLESGLIIVPDPVLISSLSYRLDRLRYLKNTEVFVSYAPLKKPLPVLFGIRLNF